MVLGLQSNSKTLKTVLVLACTAIGLVLMCTERYATFTFLNVTSSSQLNTKNILDEIDDSQNSSRVMVVDLIIYNNDPVLLFRLAILQEKVDRFYIYKPNCTSSDQTHIHQNSSNLHIINHESYHTKVRWLSGPCDASESRKMRATSVREAAQDDLKNNIISHPFVILNGDPHEIIDPNDLDELNPGGKFHQLALNTTIMLNMESFICNLNFKRKAKRKAAHILPGKKVIDGWLTVNSVYESYKARLAAASIDSGYHLEDFSHGCNSSEEVGDWSYKQAPLPLQRYHEQICEMQAVDPFTSKNSSSAKPYSKYHPISFMNDVFKDSTWKKREDSPRSVSARVMVVDSTMYNNETILPIRLAMLYDAVDRFYIIEGTHSFTGIRKSKLFKDINSHLFEPYQDKISWVIFNMTDFKGTNWQKEHACREASLQAIRNDYQRGLISHPFVVINADADEIPDPTDILDFQPGKKYHSLVTNTVTLIDMNVFYYNMNWWKGMWHLAHIIPGKKLIDGEADLNSFRIDRTLILQAPYITGGYHLSYFLDDDGIRYKLETAAHTEYNRDEFKKDEHIQYCFSTGRDLFFRRNDRTVHWDYTKAPLPLQQFHEETCKAQNVNASTGQLIF